MYNTSQNYKDKVLADSTQHELNIYIDENKVDSNHIINFKQTIELFNNNEFCLGCTPEIDIEFEIDKRDLPETYNEVYIETGVEDEIVPIGYFTIQKPIEDNEFKVKIKATDYMKKFEDNKYDGSDLTYPRTMLQVLQDICKKIGVELGSTSFLNSDKQIAVYDNTVSARTYLGYIAEQAEGLAVIGRDGKLYIRQIGQDVVEFDINLFKDYKWGDKFKVSKVSYEDGIQDYKFGDETADTVYIDQNNMYIVDREQVENIYNQIKDFEIYSFEGETIIDPAYDIGDILVIDGEKVLYQGELEYVGKFKANIKSKIQAKTEQESMQTKENSTTKMRRVQSEIDQANAKITTIVAEQTEQNKKLSQVTQTVDELNSKIQDIADITTFGESMYGKVELDSVNESEPIQIIVKPTIENISYLYLHNNLFPSDTLYLKTRAIRFTNKSLGEDEEGKYIDFIFPDDLLIAPDGTCDEFYLDYDEQICQLTKRCKYNADGTVSKLDTEQTISYEYPKIQLKDGDYIIELLGYTNAYLAIRLMAQNIYTTQFATRAEVDSEISQKADEITFTVSVTYETKENAQKQYTQIKQTTNSIQSQVNNNNSDISTLKQTSNNISLEVSKKVGNDEIISKINQSAETVGINANKIKLSANDVLNLLAGNAINLTSKNITITSDFLEITKNGKLKLKGTTQATDLLRIENINGTDFAYIACDSWGIVRSNGSIYATAEGGNFSNSTIELNGSGGITEVKNTEIRTPKLIQTSLAKEKKNFEKYTEKALDKIKDIDIYKYNLNSEKDTDKKHIGFVIGDKYKYSKEVTSTDNQGVDNYSFTSLCCKAIQEQQELIEQLQNEINELKGVSNEKNRI